jgi:hypothetical protein
MIKRKISIMLAVLMLLSVLTGCKPNEMGYLDMSAEMNSMTQYEFESSTQIEVSKFISHADKNTKIDLNISGEANIEDLGSQYLSMDVMLKVNGVGNEKPIKVILADKKYYISKNVLLEGLKIQDELGLDDYSRLVVEKLLEELKDTEYILLADTDNIYDSGIKVSQDGYSHTILIDGVKEYLKAAFKNFDSQLIEKTSNGYAMDLTSESAADFVERLIKYIGKNKEQVFDETVEFVDKLFEVIVDMSIEEDMTDSKEAAMEELKAMRHDFYAFIDEAVLLVESGEYKEEYGDIREIFDRSYLKNEIYKDGGKYGQTFEGELVYEGFIMGNIKSNIVLNPKTVKMVPVTEKSITVYEIQKMYDTLENKYNPVDQIEITWYTYEGVPDDGAFVNMNRADGKYIWGGYKPYTIVENRVYLPLRYISEALGEEVEWDNVNKKAYVVRGSEKIDMTGILSDNMTMVKIRDFEKLGYFVEYEAEYEPEYSWSTAVIRRNK